MFEFQTLSKNIFEDCYSTDFNNPFNYGHLENQPQYQEITSIDRVRPSHTTRKTNCSVREGGRCSDLSGRMMIIMIMLLCIFGISTIVENSSGSMMFVPVFPVVKSSEFNKSYDPIQSSSVQPDSEIPLLKNHINFSDAVFNVPIKITTNSTTSYIDRQIILDASSNSKDERIMCELSEHLDMPKRVMGWRCIDEDASIPPCQWTGVVCDKNHRVIVLEMKSSSIRGSLPPSIDKLSHLERLNFRDNLITGSIPPSITKIKYLREIDLSDNMLWGGVPPMLGKLSNLESLDLSNNSLTGKLPRVFDKPPSRISSMDFSGNKIAGPIPPVLGKISTLHRLLLHDNVLR